jgi:hypothetical protein
MMPVRTRALAQLALLVVAAASCAKTGTATGEQTPEEPPATAWDGAPVFRVPVDAEAAIGKAGLRVAEAAEPPLVRLRVHLDVLINDHAVTVPAGIGVIDKTRSSPLTTKDDSGVLYVASPRRGETFRLGQLFQQWNVPLDKDCIANFCASTNPQKQLLTFVNGELAADAQTIQLTDGAQIVVWYGDRELNPAVPTTYDFPAS